MTRRLSEQTVVITGASSGIGRETAIRFAERGASVVLAARSEQALNEVARACETAGGRVRVVVTDVAEAEQVMRLADEAVAWTGRIDTWINDAAVSSYGTVEESSLEEIERVIRVDLLGQIYGMKAVLPVMRRQNEGTIINIASALGERAVPLQAAYCAAKHGVKGFSESLRMELEHENSGVHVTVILPASMNTPFFNHARSRMGVQPRPIPPVYDPAIVADAILHAAEHPLREVFVGSAGKVMSVLENVAPRFLDRFMIARGNMFRQQQTSRPDGGEDNLFTPLPGPGRVQGDFGGMAHPHSFYTSFFELHPGRKRLAVAGMALLGLGALVAAARARREPRSEYDGVLHGSYADDELEEDLYDSTPPSYSYAASSDFDGDDLDFEDSSYPDYW